MNKLHVEKKLENQTDVRIDYHFKERKNKIKCKSKDKGSKYIFVATHNSI